MRQNKEIGARDLKSKDEEGRTLTVAFGRFNIDNDGDTDSSDKYLHKRRKDISIASRQRRRLFL